MSSSSGRPAPDKKAMGMTCPPLARRFLLEWFSFITGYLGLRRGKVSKKRNHTRQMVVKNFSNWRDTFTEISARKRGTVLQPSRSVRSGERMADGGKNSVWTASAPADGPSGFFFERRNHFGGTRSAPKH